MRPKRWRVWTAIAWVLWASATSTVTPSTSPPACWTWATVSEHDRISAATTWAPSRARARQYVCPIPRAAPVTMATRSLSLIAPSLQLSHKGLDAPNALLAISAVLGCLAPDSETHYQRAPSRGEPG